MTSFKRFVESGLEDAERRIADRVPPPVRDHPLVIDVVASSSIARVFLRGAGLLGVAAGSSVAARFTRQLIETWRGADWRARYRSSGATLVIAVLVHVLLLWLQGLPAGWLWSIIPAMIAAIGIVLMLSARSVENAPAKASADHAR